MPDTPPPDRPAIFAPPSQKVPTGRVVVVQTVTLVKNGGTNPTSSDRRFSVQLYEQGMALEYEIELTEATHKIPRPPIGPVGRIAIVHLGAVQDGKESGPIFVGDFKISPGGAMQGEPIDPDNLEIFSDVRGARCRITVFPA